MKFGKAYGDTQALIERVGAGALTAGGWYVWAYLSAEVRDAERIRASRRKSDERDWAALVRWAEHNAPVGQDPSEWAGGLQVVRFSYRGLADVLGLSSSAVKKHVGRMVSAGLLAVVEKGARGRATLYATPHGRVSEDAGEVPGDAQDAAAGEFVDGW